MKTITLEYVDIFDENKTKELIFSQHLISKPFKKESLFVSLVDGKSMEPLIKHRAVIVADLSQKNFINGAIYVVYYKNKMWVKKCNLANKTFMSANPKYSQLIYSFKDVHVLGRALLTFTLL